MNKAKILEAIKELHGEAAKNIESEIVVTSTPDLVSAAIEEFGSLGNAVREAGLEFFFEFEFNGVRLRSGRVEVARVLLDWAEMHGPISSQALQNTAPELLPVVTKLFGSVTRISQRIGLIMAPGEDKAPAPVQETVIEVEPPVEEDEEKEPTLLPLEPGVGEDKVECQICGKEFKRLGLHLSRTHGIGIEEYQRGEF